VLGNAVGLAASITSAVYFQKASESLITASSYGANNTIATAYIDSAWQQYRSAGISISVQSFCEVAVLLLIVAALAVVGIVSARRVSSALAILYTAGPEMAAAMMYFPAF
jgi:hypothetical protein